MKNTTEKFIVIWCSFALLWEFYTLINRRPADTISEATMKIKLPSTLNVLMTLSIIAAAWEMWTIANKAPGDTFSATIRELGTNQPFIVFMLGMLSGHLWWPLLDGQD